MSSLCLLSVDDVYEQRWLAAECLMMHKIKPRLSAALWLPSGTHTAEACWEYKLQTAIRWKELTSLFLSVSEAECGVYLCFVHAAEWECVPSWAHVRAAEEWDAINVLYSIRHLTYIRNNLLLPCSLCSHHAVFSISSFSRLCPSIHPWTRSHCVLPPFISLLSFSLPRRCFAAAVYDKNIIILLLNNPINLSTGRKLTSCLFDWCLPDHVTAATVNSNH